MAVGVVRRRGRELLPSGKARPSGGAGPSQPGIAEQGNRAALAELGKIRAVLPAGAGRVTPREFETIAAQSFDRPWLAGLA